MEYCMYKLLNRCGDKNMFKHCQQWHTTLQWQGWGDIQQRGSVKNNDNIHWRKASSTFHYKWNLTWFMVKILTIKLTQSTIESATQPYIQQADTIFHWSTFNKTSYVHNSQNNHLPLCLICDPLKVYKSLIYLIHW